MIQAGNRELRVRIETACRLMRRGPRWQTLVQTLKARGKKSNVAAAVVGTN